MRAGLTRRVRPTVRLRLTLLYGALFVVTGALLLILTYALLEHALSPPSRDGNRSGPGQTQGQGRGPGDDHGPNAGAAGATTDAGDANATPAAIATPALTVQQQIDQARREDRASTLRQVKIQAGLALLVATVIAVAFGWLVAGRVLRPIRQITGHARRASHTTLGERIALAGPRDELKELADTIDDMLERLEAAFEAQRRFSAEASHELRTPLAIIRAEADVALAEPGLTAREQAFAEAIRDAADRSERLVDGLLALARSESTLRDDRAVALDELTGDVVGEQIGAADRAGVELELELEAAAVAGDPALLGRLVGNLVENAIRYNARGGWIRVAVTRTGTEAILLVENIGPAVAPEAVEELFQPFRRGADRRERPGFGLGLAIVRSVARVHGGVATASARPDGGLLITVRLPLTA